MPFVAFNPDPSGEVVREKPRCTTNCGTIYWGLVDADLDHSDFANWDDAEVEAVITTLESETGPYRTTGYFYPNPGPDVFLIAWFVVPDSFPDPLTDVGFQFGAGEVETPDDEVMTQAEATPLQDVNTLLNGPAGTSSSNGWSYTLRTYNGIVYRFYFFEEYRSQLVGEGTDPNNLVLRSRSGGIATVKAPGGDNFSYGSPYSRFYNMGDPSFDEYFVLTTTNGTNVVTYPNGGPDVAEVANATSNWELWERGPWPLIGNIGDDTLTLFVES